MGYFEKGGMTGSPIKKAQGCVVRVERLTLRLVLSAALLSAGAAARYFDVHLTNSRQAEAEALTSGNVEKGRRAIDTYGCGACHTIPGVRTARGLVGPPLNGFGEQIYIAGTLPNTVDNLAVWISHPTRVNPQAAMPKTGITEAKRATSRRFSIAMIDRQGSCASSSVARMR